MSTTDTHVGDWDGKCIRHHPGCASMPSRLQPLGTPIGIAPVTYVLWQQFLRFDPTDPIWPNDRYVLSAATPRPCCGRCSTSRASRPSTPTTRSGTAVAVSLDDLKHFRQLDSKAPGTPSTAGRAAWRRRPAPGDRRCHVRRHGRREPVARGAVQPRRAHALRLRRVRPGRRRLHDGGHLVGGRVVRRAPALSNLCWIYDSNRVTIEGHTDITFTEDVAARFTLTAGTSPRSRTRTTSRRSRRRSTTFAAEHERPTLILVHSHIGYGTDVEDTPKAHGEPLGVERRQGGEAVLRLARGCGVLRSEGVYEHFADGIGARGKEAREAWESAFAEYRPTHPDLADEIEQMQRRELPEGWDADIPTFPADEKGIASRDSSGQVLNALAKNMPWLLGGAADLAPSTKTRLTFDGAGDFEPGERNGRNFHFGVREHASAAIATGCRRTEAASVLVRLPDLLRLRAGRSGSPH